MVRGGVDDVAVGGVRHMFYCTAALSYDMQLGFVFEAVACGVGALCERSRTRASSPSDLDGLILALFYRAGSAPAAASAMRPASRASARPRSSSLATYLRQARSPRPAASRSSMAGEDLARVAGDPATSSSRVESKDFWRIIDRGRNFEYMHAEAEGPDGPGSSPSSSRPSDRRAKRAAGDQAFEDDLAGGVAGLGGLVGAAQVGVDGAEVLAERGLELARSVTSSAVASRMLCCSTMSGSGTGAGEHELPGDELLRMSEPMREALGLDDEADLARRLDDRGERVDVRVGRGQAERCSRPRAPGRRGRGVGRRGAWYDRRRRQAPSSRTQRSDSGREAVAITRRPASFLASWIAIEPTPPAPPMIRSEAPRVGAYAEIAAAGRTAPPRR